MICRPVSVDLPAYDPGLVEQANAGFHIKTRMESRIGDFALFQSCSRLRAVVFEVRNPVGTPTSAVTAKRESGSIIRWYATASPVPCTRPPTRPGFIPFLLPFSAPGVALRYEQLACGQPQRLPCW